MADRRPADRRRTTTSSFGAGRREAHDASPFYSRFEAPELSESEEVPGPVDPAEPLVCGDSRDMAQVHDGSVALVVTSPPYFAGKQYEEELDRAGIPGSYLEYLDLLRDVFAECRRKLEPGGRIAVNVANLGRKPYRSLSSDVVRILQDDLNMLLRGEIIWRKADGASGSCAWGSFRSAANPVIRDLTERVVVASKGRFNRALGERARRSRGLPFVSSLPTDEFMAATLDVWDIPPESATRVRHPAPFPVELPERLILLYTFKDDLVLDPFMGSGSAMVAAARTGRRYVGYELEERYVSIARERLSCESAPPDGPGGDGRAGRRPPWPENSGGSLDAAGGALNKAARVAIESAGFRISALSPRVRGAGTTVPVVAEDRHGVSWYFDLSGAYTVTRAGLARTEGVWRSLGRAHVLARHGCRPLVLLSSHLPKRGCEADLALRAAGPATVFDAMEITSEAAMRRLRKYALGRAHAAPLEGFWTAGELSVAGDGAM